MLFLITILDKMDKKIKSTPPPISMMEKRRVFVVARVHYWIEGRGVSNSHFILAKFVTTSLINH